MTLMLMAALSVGIPSICWMVVRIKAALVTQQVTQKALEGCPPAERAGVLRASAELANNLSAERTTTKPISLSLASRQPPHADL